MRNKLLIDERKEICETCERYLKVMRIYLGWKQRDLAELVGTTHRRISEIETGKAKISWTLFLAFYMIFSRESSAKRSPVYNTMFRENVLRRLIDENFKNSESEKRKSGVM